MRIFSLCLLLFFALSSGNAQETANFTQFFVDPFSINPSYAGIEGRTGLYMTYRHQWAGFEGAPRVGNFAFHTAATSGFSLGLSFNYDKRSILETNSALLTFAYNLRLARNSYLRFGISGGGATNTIDYTEVNQNDPAFFVNNDNNAFLLGNAGVSLHVGTFHAGVSLPQLFEPQWISETDFSYYLDTVSFSDFYRTSKRRFIAHASNRFYFGNDKHVFEPYILYRMHENLPPQLEAAAILHLNHALWFGGTYKQDFGVSATAGIKTAKFGVGYSYTFKNLGVNMIQSPTHEVTVSLLFGKKKEKTQKYSFINTEKDPEPVVVKKDPEPCVVPSGLTNSNLTTNTVSLNWTEGETATGYNLEYRTQGASAAESFSLTTVTRNLQGLTPNTTYEWRVQTVCSAGKKENISDWSAYQSFTTEPEPEPCTVPSDLTISTLTHNTATLSWTPSGAAETFTIEYAVAGTGETLTATASGQSNTLAGLNPSESYEWRIMAICPDGATNESDWSSYETFTTQPEPEPVEPVVVQPEPEPVKADVTVKKGGHEKEIPLGNYVVVGVYSTEENAQVFVNKLHGKGYQEAQFGYITERGYWYVYVHKTDDPNFSRTVRDTVRKMKEFKDAWTLEVRE